MAEFTKEQIQAELELRKRNKPSGELASIIASLTNDEKARIDYLKKKGFLTIPMLFILKMQKMT